MLEPFFLILHVIGTATWIGAVFMGSFIDFPLLRKIARGGKFPFDFIVGQGTRVFGPVYFGAISMVVSGVGLTILHPPKDATEVGLLAVKSAVLAFMVGSTIYGTFRTWPKLQFALNEEAWVIYSRYNLRANITFLCGLIALVCGVILSRKDVWFPG